MANFSDIGTPPRRFGGSLSVAELSLISQIQSRSSARSVGELRTGRISMSELMGTTSGGSKNDRQSEDGDFEGGRMASSWGPSLGPHSPFGIRIDHGALFDNPNWNVPPPHPSLSFGGVDGRRSTLTMPPQFTPQRRHQPVQALPLYYDDFQRHPVYSSAAVAQSNMFVDGQSVQHAGLNSQASSAICQRCSPVGRNIAASADTGREFAASKQRDFVRFYPKSKKPYFLPYFSVESVARGVAQGDLVEGALLVDKFNKDEYYVECGNIDSKQTIAVVGLRDRNRALHGDLVVVRVKQRRNWIVRDALYEAWRGGYLKASVDDDGRPITVPPLRMNVSEYVVDELQNAATKSAEHIRKYSRDELICVAFATEIQKRYGVCELPPKAFVAVKKLGIGKQLDSPSLISQLSAALTTTVTISCSSDGVSEVMVGNDGQRRSGYRLLSSLGDADWGIPDICLQKTGEVVYISEQRNSRTVVGTLKTRSDGSRKWVLFSTEDPRMPRMMIPAGQLPAGFFTSPQQFAKFIYVARMVDWHDDAHCARGQLYRSLGPAGDLDAETEGLLLMNDVDTREFSSVALSSLPVSESTPWHIDEHEFKYRRDFRGDLVFTIDSTEICDIQDALHIKPIDDCDGLGNPGFEVGVHVADVSYFVHEGTELDIWASCRATNVKLVHKVIPMLPRVLREELCSLSPGVDRLAFSVVWKMNDDGEVHHEWFGRSVVHSCSRLTASHAQKFLDNPLSEFDSGDFPEVFNNRKVSELRDAIVLLNKIAEYLRTKRNERGCLHLEQPWLTFTLNEKTGAPEDARALQRTKAQSIVSELMLLANVAVARKIEDTYPGTALLRRHPPPKSKILLDVLEQCRKIGFEVEGTSSASITESLRRCADDSDAHRIVRMVLTHMLSRPMQPAAYVCAGAVHDNADLAHYALAVPLYTHFTSPLSRYPDVMVHRQLSAALGYSPVVALTAKEIETVASHCNERSAAAEMVYEASSEMFFGMFVKAHGPLEERAVVLSVFSHSFDVLLVKYGLVKRVLLNDLQLALQPLLVERPRPELILFWEREKAASGAIEQVIRTFTLIDVLICSLPERFKYQVTLKQPTSEERPFSLAELFAQS